MKIIIKSVEGNTNINLRLPMRIVITLLRIGKPFIKIDYKENSKINEVKNIINRDDINKLIKGLKYLNKHHKGLVLVDIEDSGGDIVKIQI